MSNKLRDIFTKKPLERKIRLDFFDEEGYYKFIEGIEKVGKEGCPVEIEGVKAIHDIVGNGAVNYLDVSEERIVKSFLYPSCEPITIKINTDYGEKEVVLDRIILKNGFLIKTSIGNIVELYLKSNNQNDEIKFGYSINVKNADSIKNLKHNIATTLAFCKYLFKNEDKLKKVQADEESQVETIKGVIDFFSNSLRLYEHLDIINDEFGLEIVPSDFGDSNNFEDVEELYYSLSGVPIRSIESFSSLKSEVKDINIKNKDELVGTVVNLTFSGKVTYDILGHEVSLYSANYLCNAVVADFEEIDDDRGTILLEPEKGKTMYFSYTAYKTVGEVNEGMKEIINKRSDYYNAPTIRQLIAGKYENKPA